MVVQPTADLEVGGSIPGRPAFVGATIGWLGFEPLTCKFTVGCFTTRPLRVLGKGKIGLRGGGGGGGSREPPEGGGGGSSNGAPVTGTMVKSQFSPHFCHFFTEFRN